MIHINSFKLLIEKKNSAKSLKTKTGLFHATKPIKTTILLLLSMLLREAARW